VWAAVGRDKATLRGFFDLLGPQRCERIHLVGVDAAEWIGQVVQERCLNATLCTDAFHVVAWCTATLDEVRREVWNEARKAGMTQHAEELKRTRYALWRNPEDLTARQEAKLSWIAKFNARLYRAGASNGPTEGLNLCVKKVKQAGRGFTCFEHYRLRVLLHAGGVTWPRRASPPRIRTRTPHSNA
jgi:transposase